MKIYLKPTTTMDVAMLLGSDVVMGATLDGERITSICTDSREAEKGSLFVAIRGERVDGHDYIEKAIENGALAVCCEKMPDERADICYIVVDDSVRALMRAAASYREQCASLRSVAVTGSVGKTTAKEMIYAALSANVSTFKTEGNFNSIIGMPMALLSMPSDTPYAVYEMGMSGLGEIESMSNALRPDVAVITNIGHSHLEMLGTRENILRAKLEILSGLKTGGTLIINAEDEMLKTVDFSIYPCRVIRCSANTKNADLCAENIRYNGDQIVFDLITPEKNIANVTVPGTGVHNVTAALFAIAVAYSFGVSIEKAADGLADFRNAAMRQNVRSLGGFTLIEDCYNAAPESMKAALSVLERLKSEKCGRAFALLGDMKELGDNTEELHFGVGKFAAEHGADSIVTLGPLAKNIASGAIFGGVKESEVFSFLDPDEFDGAADKLLSLMKEGDVLLVKASRSIRAERVISALEEKIAK